MFATTVWAVSENQDPDDCDLTVGEAAVILGVSASTVARTPYARLPYRRTPGGVVRRGRRIYRREDVERLKAELERGE